MTVTTYGSTRGGAENPRFAEIIFDSISENGGLYLPHEIPQFSDAAVNAMRAQPLPEVTYRVLISLGLTYDIPAMVLQKLCYDAYKKFDTDDSGDVLPIKHFTMNGYIANFHYGPTQAFKDYALAVFGKIVAYLLEQQGKRGLNATATSGDTGPAAQANVSSDNAFVLVLYPDGGVSGGQERQMVHFSGANAQAYACEDLTFDGCQRIIRTTLGNRDFRQEIALQNKVLFAANSINWLRVAVQIGYMFYLSLKPEFENVTDLTFVIPSGNFGSALSGLYAQMMGAPITQIHMATNENDILRRVVETGSHIPEKTIETTSPAMDIGYGTNFERILHTLYGADAVADWFKDGQEFNIDQDLERLQNILQATTASMNDVDQTIRRFLSRFNIMLDTHSATAAFVTEPMLSNDSSAAFLSFSSAHSSKFEIAVRNALGDRYSEKILYRGISENNLIPYRMTQKELSARRKIITNASPEFVMEVLRNK